MEGAADSANAPDPDGGGELQLRRVPLPTASPPDAASATPLRKLQLTHSPSSAAPATSPKYEARMERARSSNRKLVRARSASSNCLSSPARSAPLESSPTARTATTSDDCCSCVDATCCGDEAAQPTPGAESIVERALASDRGLSECTAWDARLAAEKTTGRGLSADERAAAEEAEWTPRPAGKIRRGPRRCVHP